MEQSDYYQVLGVEKKTGQEQIKEAYRELALKYHPDRNADGPDTADRMKAVNEAYAVLSDPDKRREYDTLHTTFGANAHSHFRNSYSDHDIFSGSDIHQVFEEIARASGIRGFDEIFKGIYGRQGFRSFQHRGPGFFAGGFVFGQGMGRGRGRGRGRRMGGGGPRQSLRGRGAALGALGQMLLNQMAAGRAAGAGRDITEPLPLDAAFAASGGPWAYHVRKRDKKLVVTIPPGVKNGQRIRLRGMGAPGSGGGPAGDLYLKVSIRKPVLEKLKGALRALVPKKP